MLWCAARPPPLLHQTWKVSRPDDMEPEIAECVRSWDRVGTWDRHHVYDDQECAAFVQEYYPQYADLYFNQLTRPVERADVFRYLVVHRFGGWYADIDTAAHRPLSTLEGDLIVAKEFDLPDADYQVLQYCFGAVPRHPFFTETLMPLIEQTLTNMAS